MGDDINSLKERMTRLEVRMDALEKQMQGLRDDLHGHFSMVERKFDELPERIVKALEGSRVFNPAATTDD